MRQRRGWKWWGSVGMVSLLVMIRLGTAQWWQADIRVIETVDAGQIDWTQGLVLSRQQGRSTDVHGAGGAAMQADAAARQELMGILTGVRLDASRRLGEALQTAGVATQEIQALVSAAEVFETHYRADGTVERAMQLPLRGRLVSLLLPTPVASGKSGDTASTAVYTGVVIDARGLLVQPVMFPRIVDESGRTVYAPETVDPAIAAQRGYIAYAKAFDRPLAQERVGDNPLVIRARRLAGDGHVDLELHHVDAERILDYTATQELLRRCQVLIVM